MKHTWVIREPRPKLGIRGRELMVCSVCGKESWRRVKRRWRWWGCRVA